MVRQRGTSAGSSKVVGVDDLAHGQRDCDGRMRPGRCEHLRATNRHMAALSASRCESVNTCCSCTQAAAVAEDEVGAQNFR